MSDTANESGFTIKAGKGYEAMWLTPKGSPAEIVSWLMEAFGFTEDMVGGMTPYEVAVMAEDVMQGRRNLAAQLGAVQLSTTEQQARPSGATGEAAWAIVDGEAGGQQTPAVNENQWLIEALTNAATVDDLKRLWAENKAAFSDEAVKGAYSARGAALKAAAA
jgi:hypothetical protein